MKKLGMNISTGNVKAAHLHFFKTINTWTSLPILAFYMNSVPRATQFLCTYSKKHQLWSRVIYHFSHSYNAFAYAE